MLLYTHERNIVYTNIIKLMSLVAFLWNKNSLIGKITS
ncbi:hypothetical protein J2Z39_000616 [Anaerococcus nagyae]|nr:hypothetical protein [Anaerococcus nagyae]